jgi:hypothetical protein
MGKRGRNIEKQKRERYRREKKERQGWKEKESNIPKDSKIAVFWDVTPCKLRDNNVKEEIYCPHANGRRFQQQVPPNFGTIYQTTWRHIP